MLYKFMDGYTDMDRVIFTLAKEVCECCGASIRSNKVNETPFGSRRRKIITIENKSKYVRLVWFDDTHLHFETNDIMVGSDTVELAVPGSIESIKNMCSAVLN